MALLAALQKRLDRALVLCIFIHEVRLSCVRASVTVVHIRFENSKNCSKISINRPFSYSEKEPQSNDVCLHLEELHLEEFSNVRNSDRSPNATRSNFAYKNV